MIIVSNLIQVYVVKTLSICRMRMKRGIIKMQAQLLQYRKYHFFHLPFWINNFRSKDFKAICVNQMKRMWRLFLSKEIH